MLNKLDYNIYSFGLKSSNFQKEKSGSNEPLQVLLKALKHSAKPSFLPGFIFFVLIDSNARHGSLQHLNSERRLDITPD